MKNKTAMGPIAGFSRSRGKVLIFDTTLRDGEQSPGATLTHGEKIRIAEQLERLNVDVIEAGFPIASDGDFKAVKEIAETVGKLVVCGLARTLKKDIERAWQAIQNAKRPRIHTFIATSEIHMRYKLKMPKAAVLKQAKEMVSFAKSLCDDVEFSAEDASRSSPEFLFKVFEAVIDAGASTINIPDTVGYSQPEEFAGLVKAVRENVPNIGDAAISVHCHDDLGLAVANSLAAVKSGAAQVECTVNGLGERAGNASLEEIAMNIHTRTHFFGVGTGINLKEIHRSSKMVSELTGIAVQRNKAIVGENAFSHEAGIHQHGMLSNSKTYEIMNPEMIGKQSRLVLGKHSGKHAVMAVFREMGFFFSERQIEEAAAEIKRLADRQKGISGDDLQRIASDFCLNKR